MSSPCEFKSDFDLKLNLHVILVPFNLIKVKSVSHVQLFVTPWIVAYQAAQSMEFSRQEYWSGLLFPSPGDLPNSGIEPGSPTLQADTLLSESPGKPNLIKAIPKLKSVYVYKTLREKFIEEI